MKPRTQPPLHNPNEPHHLRNRYQANTPPPIRLVRILSCYTSSCYYYHTLPFGYDADADVDFDFGCDCGCDSGIDRKYCSEILIDIVTPGTSQSRILPGWFRVVGPRGYGVESGILRSRSRRRRRVKNVVGIQTGR